MVPADDTWQTVLFRLSRQGEWPAIPFLILGTGSDLQNCRGRYTIQGEWPAIPFLILGTGSDLQNCRGRYTIQGEWPAIPFLILGTGSDLQNCRGRYRRQVGVACHTLPNPRYRVRLTELQRYEQWLKNFLGNLQVFLLHCV